MNLRTAALVNHAGIVAEFIADELNTRKKSFFPNPAVEECIALGAADLALNSAVELQVGLMHQLRVEVMPEPVDTFAAGSVKWPGRRG